MKAILVNSTFATKGGAKTILDQFINNADKYYRGQLPILIFAPKIFRSGPQNNIIIENVNFKSWAKRLYWETFGIHIWLYKEHINPVLYISLQNNGLFYKKNLKNIKQIIYFHQSIPFESNISWNLFRKSEFKMWIYRYVYLLFVRLSVRRKKDIFIVQTKWIKNEMMKHILFKDFKILTYKPDLPLYRYELSDFNKPKDKYILFFPAFDYKYKNHILLLDLVKVIKASKSKLCNKIKFVITLDNQSRLFSIVKENSFEEYFDFVGSLTSNEIYQMYYQADVLIFPSLLETFGLPLLEAAQTGLPILSIDKAYSREVLDGYEGVIFADESNIEDWVKKLENMLNIRKRYENFIPRYKCSWKDFFDLVQNEVYHESI